MENDLQKQLSQARNALLEVSKLNQQIKTKNQEITNQIEKMIKEVDEGKTTGNPMLDFIIIKSRLIPLALEQVYNFFTNLQLTLEQHPKEWVLVVEREEKVFGPIYTTSSGQFFPPRQSVDSELVETISLGQLARNKPPLAFDIKNTKWVFQTEFGYVFCQVLKDLFDSHVKEMCTVNANLHTSWRITFLGEWLCLDQLLTIGNNELAQKLGKGQIKELEIIVGNKEVEDWFEKNDFYKQLLKDLKKMLGP